MKLQIVPCSISDAAEFVSQHHRHHRPPVSGLFALACAKEVTSSFSEGKQRLYRIEGVAIVGRPIARGIDDGWTAEVTRVCTLGERNACSILYSACWRAARAIGYRKLITYTLASESGASLRGAGWKKIAEVRGRSWHCSSRPRVDRHPTQDKFRWEISD